MSKLLLIVEIPTDKRIAGTLQLATMLGSRPSIMLATLDYETQMVLRARGHIEDVTDSLMKLLLMFLAKTVFLARATWSGEWMGAL